MHSAGGEEAWEDEAATGVAAPAPIGERAILLPEPWRSVTAAVYDREDLGSGAEIRGPAIVEQADTTVLIAPDWCATAVAGGNLIMERVE